MSNSSTLAQPLYFTSSSCFPKISQKAITATPGTNPVERAFEVMDQQDFDKMRKLFIILHSIAKKGRPFTDYIWSVDLHEATHGISLGETYRNNGACRMFVRYIAETELLVLTEAIKKALFYSVLTDSSTDSSVRLCMSGTVIKARHIKQVSSPKKHSR